MTGEFRNPERDEIRPASQEGGFRDIKPKEKMTMEEAEGEWKSRFEEAKNDVGNEKTEISAGSEVNNNTEGKEASEVENSIKNADTTETSKASSELKNNDIESKDQSEIHVGNGVQNKIDGCRREEEVKDELCARYPESEEYKVIPEAYLRDKEGNIVKDAETGTARRIDFVVTKNDSVTDMVEVTSKTAPKVEQMAKEYRIREAGGNYIKDGDGNLIKIPNNVETRVVRKD